MANGGAGDGAERFPSCASSVPSSGSSADRASSPTRASSSCSTAISARSSSTSSRSRTTRRLYSAVCDALGGAGTPDLSAALQDVALKELYAALAALVTPELLAWAGGLVRPEAAATGGTGKRPRAKAKTAAAPKIPEGIAPAAKDFYGFVRGMLRREAAEEGLPGDPERVAPGGDPERVAPGGDPERVAPGGDPERVAPGGDPERVAPGGDPDASAVAAACERLAAGLAAVSAIASSKSRPASESEVNDQTVFEELVRPGRPQLALCYLVLDALRPLVGMSGSGEEARRLTDRLCLDRKLREALRGTGMHGDEVFHGMALAKAFLARSGGPVRFVARSSRRVPRRNRSRSASRR